MPAMTRRALYEQGKFNEALQEFVKAGGNGDVEAVYRAALMFEAGEGTAKEDAQAMAKAADGLDRCTRGPQGCHEEAGKDVRRRSRQAAGPGAGLAILQIAADRGDKEAAAQRDALAETMRPGQLQAGKRRLEKIVDAYEGS